MKTTQEIFCLALQDHHINKAHFQLKTRKCTNTKQMLFLTSFSATRQGKIISFCYILLRENRMYVVADTLQFFKDIFSLHYHVADW